MKISEVLVAVGDVKPSQYEPATMIRWISDLDGKVYEDIMAGFEGCPEKPELPYSPTNQLASLLIPFPHEDVYVKWLMAQIDFHNADFDRYNNSMLMFDEAYQSFADAYARNHKRIPVHIKGVRGDFA